MDTNNLAIIGRGAFGTALATVYRRDQRTVQLLGRESWPDQMPPIILLAVPTKGLGEVMERLAARDLCDRALVLCCKGIDPQTGRLPSELVSTVSSQVQPFVLSGPGFAQDLANGRPVAHTLAHKQQAETMAKLLSTAAFRLYHCDDPVGVQLCGALKNIIAIAAGVADGLSLGESARAALVTRASVELRRLLVELGGRADTLWTMAGIGDLMLTCGSPMSRNFQFGQRLATGENARKAEQAIGTVEGLDALRGLSVKTDLSQAPICHGLLSILSGSQTPTDVVAQWMARTIKAG